MCLLEHKAMPSLRDIAQDGWLMVMYIYYITAAGSPGRATITVWKDAGGTARPSRTKSHPARSLSSSQPGGPPCWASPLVFGLIGNNREVETKAR